MRYLRPARTQYSFFISLKTTFIEVNTHANRPPGKKVTANVEFEVVDKTPFSVQDAQVNPAAIVEDGIRSMMEQSLSDATGRATVIYQTLVNSI
jgi:hypothetical protein